MKNFIRKVSAVGTGFALLGMSIGGAVAADLADLPEPFVVSDSYVGTAMVIGSTEDSAARSTLKTYFDGFATEVAAGLGDQIETQEVKLQDSIANSEGLDTAYDDSDSSIFEDGEVSIGGTSYDYHTELQLSNTASDLDIETSLTSNDDKYATDVKLEVKKDALKFCYVFDEHVNLSSQITTTNPFDMTFLGRTLRIDTVDSNTSFTAQVGDSWSGHPGEVYSGNGITMEVVSVDGTSAIVDFGNDQRTISEGSTVSEGEIDVYLDTAIAGVGSIDEAVATFIIGEDARTTYTDGNKFPTYCSPSDAHGDPDCDKNNPDWVWDIKGLITDSTAGASGTYNSICAENDFEAYNYNKDPAGVGEYYGFPEGFAYVGVDDLTVADTDYMQVSLTAETGNTVDLSNAGNYPSSAIVLTIEADQTEGLVIDQSALDETGLSGDQETDIVYIWTNTTHQNGAFTNSTSIFYVDSDNDIQEAGNLTFNEGGNGAPEFNAFAFVKYDNTKSTDMVLQLAGNLSSDDSLFLGFVPSTSLSSNDNLWFRIQSDIDSGVDGTFQGFGDTDNDESDEVIWGETAEAVFNTTGWFTANTTSNSVVHIGGKTYDLRTGYGLTIDATDTAGDNDQFIVNVPNNQVKANVAIYEGGGAASGSEADLVTASEDLAGYTNLVLVGGPAVNSATADFLGLTFPAYGDASGIALDTAVVKFVEKDGQMALIVAGWEKADTQRAASEVASEGLAGESMVV
jgi:hypothetical protein